MTAVGWFKSYSRSYRMRMVLTGRRKLERLEVDVRTAWWTTGSWKPE